MAELGGLTPEQQNRISAMLSWYESQWRAASVPSNRPQSQNAYIPTFIGKLTSASTSGGSASAQLWSSTAASTTAEVATGSSVTVHDWIGIGGSSGDKVTLTRHARSGRLHFQRQNPMAVVKVAGNSAADNELVRELYANGKIIRATPGSTWTEQQDCYITSVNIHELYDGAYPLVEGSFLHGRYADSYDGGSGVRPTFEVRSQVTTTTEVSLYLSTGWTVTSDAATLIPFDAAKPIYYDDSTQLVYANTTPASDNSKIYLKYAIVGHYLSWSVTVALPSSVSGTKYAQNGQFRFFPFTVRPYLDGSALSGYERAGSLWVPPNVVTTGAASAGTAHTHDVTFSVENETTDDNFAGCVATVAGHGIVDPVQTGEGSYLQLFIEDADDAVVLYGDLTVRSLLVAFR